jgi:hypothetical protein
VVKWIMWEFVYTSERERVRAKLKVMVK